jgi:hypothetical protein
MGTGKAIALTGIFLFFTFIAFISLYSDNDMNNTGTFSTDYNTGLYSNLTMNKGSTETATILNAWDIILRFLDVFTIGIFFYTNGLVMALINLFLLTPIRIFGIILIYQLLRSG